MRLVDIPRGEQSEQDEAMHGDHEPLHLAGSAPALDSRNAVRRDLLDEEAQHRGKQPARVTKGNPRDDGIHHHQRGMSPAWVVRVNLPAELMQDETDRVRDRATGETGSDQHATHDWW